MFKLPFGASATNPTQVVSIPARDCQGEPTYYR